MKVNPISPIQPAKNHLRNSTKVIFRKTRTGEIIALFPELPGTSQWYADYLSYQSNGQHAPARIDIHQHTKYATRLEAEPLVRELTSLGYRLDIVQRFTAQHLSARKAAIDKPS